MVITGIQKRKGFLEALYIDGEYAVDIDRETLLISKLKIGSIIDDEELYDLIKASNNKRAKERALYYLSRRDHSKKELIDKLKRNFDKDSAIFAADKMEYLGLINDESFAKKYAHDLIFIKHHSPQRALRELTQKGIDKDVAMEVLDNIDPDIYKQIYDLVERKYEKYLCDEKGKRKTIAALQRLGYKWDDIRHVLNEFIKEDY